MYEPKMELTNEQRDILNGKQGETMAKIMETVVMFGDMFEAPRLIKVTHDDGHLVTSFGSGICKPLFSTMDRINEAGITTKGKFTVDPRPYDYKNVKCSLLDKLVYSKILFSQQKRYEGQLTKVGLRDSNAFTCTSYLPEVGNIPKKGDILSWSESSAVVFANSVLGARCNRNSGMVDIFGSSLGVVPEFGFLLDENRKATWIIDIKTTKKPEAQILGSAIGIKVMDAVPYIKGLDKFLGTELNPETIAYLKDFGAATASNGAVGLYHIDKITPEAKEQGEKLIKEGANIYVIDDAELERVYNSYPIMWKNKEKKANICFIGCPHLNYFQLLDWHDRLESALEGKKRKKVTCHVVFNAAPKVVEHFKNEHPDLYKDFYKMGASISSICPLMYTNNPLTHKKAII